MKGKFIVKKQLRQQAIVYVDNQMYLFAASGVADSMRLDILMR